MAVEITITDEQTRWIVQTIAWNEGCAEMGDFDLGCRTDSLQKPEDYSRSRAEAARRIAKLTEMTALADRIERVALGARIEIPTRVASTIAEERAGLHDCLVSPGPNFTDDHAERARWMYSAAEALEAELSGAVA
jgi:hypothetical protein